MTFYACPFNYVGGKSKLLPVLVPLFASTSEKVFVDLFGGGFSVGLNVANTSVWYNDINADFVALLERIKVTPFERFEHALLAHIGTYQLSKTNREGYLRLRSDFNATRDPLLFCLLIFYSFNHQIRYNNALGFNTPFGMNRSSYNPRTRQNLRTFFEIIQTKQVTFSSLDFEKVAVPDNAVVYIDPPYLITTGSYNDGNRGVSSWNESCERRLYEYIDRLNARNIPFVLSNMLKKGDHSNELLRMWSRAYTILPVATSYKNYQRSNYATEEIIVTNMPQPKRDIKSP